MMPWRTRGEHRCVADVAAAIILRITVEYFSIRARFRHPNEVTFTYGRRKVAGNDHEVVGVLGLSHPNQNAVASILAIDPLEAGTVELVLVEGRLFLINPVQVAKHALHAAVRFPLQQIPLEALIMLPFAPLTELASHEQQLLAGMAPHVTVEQTQVGEALPEIAGHLISQRAFAVHHFVVRKRQREVLAEGVDQAEG